MGCFFSGHRTLPEEAIRDIYKALGKQIYDAVSMGISEFYAGGAVGFDMISSVMVLNIKKNFYPKINLHLVIPTPDYGWKLWVTDEQKRLYKEIMSGAESIETVSDHYYKTVYYDRNQRLTKYGDELGIVYADNNHDSGGTYQTIREARKKCIRIVNIYELIYKQP